MQTVYNIVNRFMVDDRATRAVGRMAASFSGLNSSIFSARSALGTLFMTGGTIGIYMALMKLKQGLFDYNDMLEQSKISFAAIFSAARTYIDPFGTKLSGLQNYNAAVRDAGWLMRQFQVDAAKSVGETKDFIDISRSIADPLARMGKSTQDIREFTRLTVNAAAVLGVDFPQAARDMMSSLTGVAGIDVKLYRLLGSPGGGAKRFNALAPTERYDLLVKALERYKIAAQEFEISQKGLWSTVTDRIKITLGKAGEPFFETWKSGLRGILDWINRNDAAIERFARNAGTRLAQALQMIFNFLRYIVAHKNELITVLSLMSGYKITKGLFGVTTGGALLSNVKGRIGRTDEALKIAQAGYPNLAAMGLFPGLSKVVGLFKGGAYGANATKAAAGLGATGGALLVIAIVVAVVAAAIVGFITNTLKSADHLKRALNRLIGVVIALVAPDAPLGQFIRLLWEIFKVIGGVVVHAIAFLIDGLAYAGAAFNKFISGVLGAVKYLFSMQALKDAIVPGGDSFWKNLGGAFAKSAATVPWPTANVDYLKEWGKGAKKKNPLENPLGSIPNVENLSNPKNITNINGGVHIYQQYKENMEPDRIAFATVNLLNKLARNPVQARNSIAYPVGG